MKINEIEIRELMRQALQGRIDKNDLTGTEKANILYFARQDYNKGLKLVNDLMLANTDPDADPDKEISFWVNCVPEIEDALKLIEWLEPDETRILKSRLKTDGAEKLYNEIQAYLNDWRSHTKADLELKSRQARQTIKIFERSLIDRDHLRTLKISELDTVKYYIKLFQNLSEDISIRLEKYSNQSDQPQKKTSESITYQWTKQPGTQLPKLYSQLIDGCFIAASETSSETFIACFTGQPVKSVTEKLQWLESKVLLAYFLDCLISFKKLPEKTNLWSIAEKVFIDAANLKQAKANFKSYGNPDGYERIDKILTDL